MILHNLLTTYEYLCYQISQTCIFFSNKETLFCLFVLWHPLYLLLFKSNLASLHVGSLFLIKRIMESIEILLFLYDLISRASIFSFRGVCVRNVLWSFTLSDTNYVFSILLLLMLSLSLGLSFALKPQLCFHLFKS